MYEFLDYRVEDVMTAPAVTIAPETSLREAEQLFAERGVNAFPVVDRDDVLVGVLTKLDVLRAFIFTEDHMFPPYDDIMKTPVAQVMTRDVQIVRPRTPLTRVLQKLVDTRSKSFPVVDSGRVVGVVAREDVLRALERAARGVRPPPPQE